MGYNIIVDHSKFENAASAIDDYISEMTSQMSSADSQVSAMYANWQGDDATSFKQKWDGVSGSDSVYQAMKESLNSYAKFLRFAGSKYKKAQANAVDRANRLAKW